MQWTIAIRMKTIISGTGFYSLKTDILKKYIMQTNILKQEEEVQGWKNMYSP